jgi:NAD(P)-dependent dehydrogenase (short-subunit alcohol dehydrogenase family)
MRMEQPVAIITGAGRGIGRAAAVELAGASYRLGLISRREQDLRETARLAGGGLVLPADVSRADEVQASIARVLEEWGRIDAVIHCAGYAPVRTVEQLSLDEWRAIIDTNLSAVFYLARAVWPTFRNQGGGVMVNLSSFSSRDPFPGLGPYGAAKAGVNLLGWAWAREGRDLGIRLHTIAPAAVETEMFRQIMTPQQFPSDQTLSPAQVARVIVQCIRGDLRHTSGEVIHLQKTV